ncbi:hypothetical protein ACWDDN_10770 [Streptomyces griseoruber]
MIIAQLPSDQPVETKKEYAVRSLARIAVVGAVAAMVATTTSTTAFATEYYVVSMNAGASATFESVGDHLYVSDRVANNHSAIGLIQIGSSEYYYWNRDGKGTTRHVNLDLPENRAIALGALEGDWQGTPTGGIIWATLSTETAYTS